MSCAASHLACTCSWPVEVRAISAQSLEGIAEPKYRLTVAVTAATSREPAEGDGEEPGLAVSMRQHKSHQQQPAAASAGPRHRELRSFLSQVYARDPFGVGRRRTR